MKEFIVVGMLRINKLKMAKKLAIFFHGKQKYGNHKYYYHLYDVLKFASENFKYESKNKLIEIEIGCILHDILEDTKCPKFLIKILFGNNIYNAIKLVSKSYPYNPEDYFNKISKNELACKIKISDRFSNINESIKNKNIKMLNKYEKEKPYFLRLYSLI